MNEINVFELNTYPVKSCAGVPLYEAQITDRGLPYDREWMVTRANGTFITARNFPQLELVQTALFDDTLGLSVPGHGEIEVPLDPAAMSGNPEIPVNVFKKPGTGIFQGQEASDFLTDFLKLKGAMLLRISQAREVNPEKRVDGYGSKIGFADGAPLLLASRASHRALEETAGQFISRARFRANMWVGWCAPYDEDHWRDIEIGEGELALKGAVAWACARCPMPDVDPGTGILPKPDERFVTQALRESRSGIDPYSGQQEAFFAQNVMLATGTDTTVHVGDRLTVVSRSDERNFQPLELTS